MDRCYSCKAPLLGESFEDDENGNMFEICGHCGAKHLEK